MVSIGKAAAVAALAPSILESCSPSDLNNPETLSGEKITLDLTADENKALATVGGAIKTSDPNNSSRPMIVSRISADSIVAFSSECTHQGCEVPLPSNNHITCPCHGATFDGSGNVLGGPARSALKTYSATLNGNVVTIET